MESVSYSALCHDYFAAWDHFVKTQDDNPLRLAEFAIVNYGVVEHDVDPVANPLLLNRLLVERNKSSVNGKSNATVTAKKIMVKTKVFGRDTWKKETRVFFSANDKLQRRNAQKPDDCMVSPAPVQITGQSKAIAGPWANAKAIQAEREQANRPLNHRANAMPKAKQLLAMVTHQGKLARQIETARQIGNQSRVDNLSDQMARNAEAITMLRKLCPELETIVQDIERQPRLLDTHKAIRLERKPVRHKRFGEI